MADNGLFSFTYFSYAACAPLLLNAVRSIAFPDAAISQSFSHSPPPDAALPVLEASVIRFGVAQLSLVPFILATSESHGTIRRNVSLSLFAANLVPLAIRLYRRDVLDASLIAVSAVNIAFGAGWLYFYLTTPAGPQNKQ